MRYNQRTENVGMEHHLGGKMNIWMLGELCYLSVQIVIRCRPLMLHNILTISFSALRATGKPLRLQTSNYRLHRYRLRRASILSHRPLSCANLDYGFITVITLSTPSTP